MALSTLTIRNPPDPHLKRWMSFVDGENFTIRGQRFAEQTGIALEEGAFFSRDVFLWLPNVPATKALTNTQTSPTKVQEHALRAHYFTSVYGDELRIRAVRQALSDLGFDPYVFKKVRREQKAKGVDITLTTTMLAHAYRNNYDVALLLGADGDYVPLVEEVKRLGKVVYVGIFDGIAGVADELRLTADRVFAFDQFLPKIWGDYLAQKGSSTTGPEGPAGGEEEGQDEPSH